MQIVLINMVLLEKAQYPRDRTVHLLMLNLDWMLNSYLGSWNDFLECTQILIADIFSCYSVFRALAVAHCSNDVRRFLVRGDCCWIFWLLQGKIRFIRTKVQSWTVLWLNMQDFKLCFESTNIFDCFSGEHKWNTSFILLSSLPFPLFPYLAFIID